jgi:ribose transport system substrate-binding protein
MRHRNSWRRGAQAIVAAIAVATLAACGSGGNSTTAAAAAGANDPASPSLTSAKDFVDQHTALPAFKPLAPAFDAASAKGKLVYNIPQSSAIPVDAAWYAGEAKAAAMAGVRIQNCPNQGQLTDWVNCFGQAFNAGAKVIVLDGPPPDQLQPQIAQAKAKGITVIPVHEPLISQFPAGAIPDTLLAGTTGNIPAPYLAETKLLADYAAVNTPGANVHALIINSSDVQPSPALVKLIQNEFAAVCPSTCTTTVTDVPVASWATRMQSQVQNSLLRDPKINWIIPLYDSETTYVVPAVQAAGRSRSVKIESYNGDSFALKFVQQGKVAMIVGENPEWLGFAFFDQALRTLATGKPYVYHDVPTPVRVFDSTNIAETGNPPSSSNGYGHAYVDGYKTLWGLNK